MPQDACLYGHIFITPDFCILCALSFLVAMRSQFTARIALPRWQGVLDGFTSIIHPETNCLWALCHLPLPSCLLFLWSSSADQQQQQLLWPGSEQSASFILAISGCAAQHRAQEQGWQSKAALI